MIRVNAQLVGHARGPVHGAISGDSMRLSCSGDAVLTGFGWFENLVRGRHPAFLAPECERGSAPHARGDIYAAGLLLWQVAAGREVTNLCHDSGEVQALLASPETSVGEKPSQGLGARALPV